MDGIVHVLCDMQSYVYMCQSIGVLVQHATFNHFELQLCIQLNLCTYVNVGTYIHVSQENVCLFSYNH